MRAPVQDLNGTAVKSRAVWLACCLALACGEHGGNAAGGDAAGHGGSGTGAESSGGGALGGRMSVESGGAAGVNGGTSSTDGGAPSSGGAAANGDGGRATANGGAASTNGGAPSGGVSSASGGSTATTGGAPAMGGGMTGTSGGAGASNGGRAGNPSTAGGNAGGGAGSGGTGAVCPRYDASHPLATLALSGNLGTHDPSLIAADGKYYLFQTGHDLPTKTSSDLSAWQGGAAVFSSNPAWIATAVPDATDLWAPDISSFGASYHLYYAASSFGKNTSCIGHATRTSLASGAWTDHGSVVCSASGDDFNAIDPNVVVDDTGTPWLAFGSFWNGIQLVELDTTGALASGAKPKFIASRPSAGGALEGAFIVRACGYYYLFTSWDHCCDSPWNYNIRVGRATSVTGPYTDKTGKALLDGGGTLLVAGDDTWTAPGHNAVIFTQNGAYNVYHALDASHANPTLRIAELAWDDDGWPVSAGP